jgi:hypothetical protein
MGDACDEIGRTLFHPDRELYPEWFTTERKQLEDVFALLDLIGWPADGKSRTVDVDLRERGNTLKNAAVSYLPLIENELEEADADDEYRAEKGKPPQKKEVMQRLAAFREFIALMEQHLTEIA